MESVDLYMYKSTKQTAMFVKLMHRQNVGFRILQWDRKKAEKSCIKQAFLWPNKNASLSLLPQQNLVMIQPGGAPSQAAVFSSSGLCDPELPLMQINDWFSSLLLMASSQQNWSFVVAVFMTFFSSYSPLKISWTVDQSACELQSDSYSFSVSMGTKICFLIMYLSR